MTQNLQTILTKNTRYIALTHVEPDFDAIGSVLALCRSLQLAGYTITGHVESVPYFMHALPGRESLTSTLPADLPDYEVISLDAASGERVYKKEWLAQAKHVINIDHHQDNPLFGDTNWINTQVSSTSEFLYGLLSTAGFPIDREVVLPLYAGLLYDTGGFRYSNTKPDTLRLASQMMSPYPDMIPALSEMVFSRWSRDSFQALDHALQRTEYWIDGRVCFTAIPYALSATLPPIAFEGIVDILRLDYSVQMILFLRETEPGVIKGSLRSKPPWTVNQLAKPFGGGGHARAAGFTVRNQTLELVKQTLYTQVETYFAEER